MPADVARDYLMAEADNDLWVVVTGVLTFDEARLPKEDLGTEGKAASTDIPARLTGQSLGPDGFARAFDRDIVLRAICLGPWCGRTESGLRHLVFLEQQGADYVAQLSPCPAGLYPEPDPEDLARVTTCFTGGRCAPEALR
ncbi:hypothetical protein LR948_12040 [Roseivivax sp. GX 12232]|uniref:hypothetical protein n=1 Tax=Roseivivax sp. GX 12232 TaxID=2900547 RepID=UPI001E636EB2|nr:hypothetical protein [Roseivivax sp. GX 12232]MCE0506092.1 hypothetical protein [Roseivivax sp. GX 12232]